MALPFDLPAAAPDPGAGPAVRAAGAASAAAAAASLGALLGVEVRVSGRALPGRPRPRGGAGRVALELAALPGPAALEADASLVVALVDRLAGGDGRAGPAAALTPVEAAALELLTLAALDGVSTVPEVELALAPRLVGCAPGPAPEPRGAFAVELELEAGAVRGRARLLLPAAAAAALEGDGELAASALRLPASLRRGEAPLTPAERAALAPGDVVLLGAPDEAASLVLPGGARARGRLVDAPCDLETAGSCHFHAEGHMERNATVPVVLEVELARVEVTLSDLARLEAGAVVPLGLDRRGRVALVVGERTVARGELVDVEGAVGVRVLEVTS
ncbi:MAG: FliM/FliN family flagellar motor switch protein [Anaeromyxobacteraceae bacterium]